MQVRANEEVQEEPDLPGRLSIVNCQISLEIAIRGLLRRTLSSK